MKQFIRFDANGRILSVNSCADDDFLLQPGYPNTILEICSDSAVDPWSHHVLGKSLVVLPPKPTLHHVFDYTTKTWKDPRSSETEWVLVREKRDNLLTKSDWTHLPDVPITTKEVWATYRQSLRDITEQPDPFNIVWPTPPVT